jgi:hypothetical protein
MSEPLYDNWPVAETGLPSRIVNCCSKAGILTLGGLRRIPDEDLFALRSFGNTSLAKLHQYLDFLREVTQAPASAPLKPLADIFAVFLEPDQLFVLDRRYGLGEQIDRISRKRMSLQRIALETGRTRERIRQVQQTALENLASRGAQYGLAPYYRLFEYTLRKKLHSSADLHELSSQIPLEATGGYHPASLLLLLHDLNPSSVTLRNQVFSLLTTEQLAQLEQHALDLLRTAERPFSIHQIARRICGQVPASSLNGPITEKALHLLTMQHPAITVTRDGYRFHTETGTANVLRDILAKAPQSPLHYREITRLFNQRIIPQSRKGSGFILTNLQKDSFNTQSGALYSLNTRTAMH